jgi:cytochrome c-type protein NapB
VNEPPPTSGARGLNLFLAVAGAVAVVGFFTGTGTTPRASGYREAVAASTQSFPRAPRQRDMEATRYAERYAAEARALEAMALPPRSLTDSVTLDPVAYQREVAERAAGRSYDGAPPTVPHAVDGFGVPACLSCHESGLAVESKVAPPMSHGVLSNCLQCHTTRASGLPFQASLPSGVSEANSFVGLASPGHGPRAWPVAPPQIPHRSFMRERCTSCHGVWSTGISSSHVSRQSCTQCHTPAAEADQAPSSFPHAVVSLDWRTQ